MKQICQCTYSDPENHTQKMDVKCEHLSSAMKVTLFDLESFWHAHIHLPPPKSTLPFSRIIFYLHPLISVGEKSLPLLTCLPLQSLINSLDSFGPPCCCVLIWTAWLPSGQQLIIIGPDHLHTHTHTQATARLNYVSKTKRKQGEKQNQSLCTFFSMFIMRHCPVFTPSWLALFLCLPVSVWGRQNESRTREPKCS